MAILTWRGSIDSNWGNASNWLGVSVPTYSDDVVFDSISPACTVNITGSASTLTFASYSSTITMNNDITVNGNVTLGVSMSIAGAASLTIGNTASLTSNGKQWNLPLILSTGDSPRTFTLNGDWYVSNFTCGTGFTTTNNLNGFKLYVSGNMNRIGTAPTFTGTTEIILNGTGTWSGAQGFWGNDITIDTLGTVNILSVWKNAGVLKWIKGTVSALGIQTFNSTTSIDTNDGFTFDTLRLSNNNVTLLSNLTTRNLELPSGSLVNINGYRIDIKNNLSVTGAGGSIGTTNFLMSGTGTWSHTAAGYIGNNLEFNTTGLISVTGSVYWGNSNKTLKYTANSGTVSFGTSTLVLATHNLNLDLNNLNIWNLSRNSGTVTYTLLSDLNIGGLYTNNASQTTINGTFSIYCKGGIRIFASTGGSYLFSGTGTPSLYLSGGTWSQLGIGRIGMNTFIDGNIALAPSTTTGEIIEWGGVLNGYTLQYLSGSVSTSLSTIRIQTNDNNILNVSDVNWWNVRFVGNARLGQNLNVYGLLSNSSGSVIQGSYSINANNGLSINNGYFLSQNSSPYGQPILNLNGGTWSANNSNAELVMNTQINGNVVVSNEVYFRSKTLTYTGTGNVITTGSTLSLTGDCTLNISGITLSNLKFEGLNTNTTIVGDIYLNGNLTTLGGNTSKTLNGGATISVAGSFISDYRGNFIKGTGTGYTIRMIGTGGILDREIGSGVGTSGHSTLDGVDLIIDTNGTINFGSSNGINTPYFGIRGSRFTYLNGTVSVASGHVFDVQSSPSTSVLDTKGSSIPTTSLTSSTGINWNIFRFNGGTLTLTSPLCIVDTHFNNQISTINGSTIYNNGSLNTSASSLSGNSTYRMTGTGTWSGVGYLNMSDFIIDTSGIITISGNVYRGNTLGIATFSYLSGTVSTTGSTLNIAGACTFDTDRGTNWISWQNVSVAAGPVTLNSNFTVNGLFSSTAVGVTFIGGNFYNCYGGVSILYSTGGTNPSQFNIYGGTWTGPAAGQVMRNRVNIYGNSTITGFVSFTDIRHYSGTVTTTGTTLRISEANYIETGGMTWSNVSFVGSGVRTTLGANLNINGLLSVSAISGLSGSSNVNCYGGMTINSNFYPESNPAPTLNLISGTWSGNSYIMLNTNIGGGSSTISGTVYFGTYTFIPTLAYTGTGTVTTGGSTLATTTANINTNPLVWGNAQFGNGAKIITFLSDFIASGNVNIGGGSTNNTLNGSTVSIGGNLTIPATQAAGSANIVLNGNGTFSGISRNNLEINSPSGTINLLSGSGIANSKIFKWTAGAVNAGTSTFFVRGATLTNIGNNIQFYDLYHDSGSMIANTDLYITRNYTEEQNVGNYGATAPNNIYIGGSYTLNGLQQAGSNLSTFVMTGTGTLSNTGPTVPGNGRFVNSIVFNSPSGTITVSGPIPCHCNITHVPGSTVPVTTGSSLIVNQSISLDTSSMTWDTVRINLIAGVGTITSTFTSTLNANILETFFGSNTLAQNMILTGSGGFTVNTFRNSSSSVVLGSVNRQITFQEGVTYTVNNSLSFPMTNTVGRLTFVSSSGTNRAIFTLNPSATQSMSYVNGTRMNSSLGKTIYSQNAVLTDTLNWSIYDPSMTGNFLLLFN